MRFEIPARTKQFQLSRASFLTSVILLSALPLSHDLLAQDPSTGSTTSFHWVKVPANGFGTSLKPVPGTPLLFAATPVRVSEFQAFVEATQYEWKYKAHFPQTPDHPVVNITLKDAAAFCAWLTQSEREKGHITAQQSYRLPTNREWDIAVGLESAKGKILSSDDNFRESQMFPWGNEWPPPERAANLNSQEINGTNDGYHFTSPVGIFQPNALGLHDLAGNVWEWAWDRDERNHAPASLRGGSWMYFRRDCLTSSYRYTVPADLRSPSVGFRYVLEDQQLSANFLATADKLRSQEQDAQRNMLSDANAVDQDEVAKMRDQLAQRRQAMEQNIDAPVAQVDIASLQPAQAGKIFSNSLGMQFVPVANQKWLAGSMEVRVADFTASKIQVTPPSYTQGESHPIVNVSWEQARAYALWLTQHDQKAGLIPAGAKYRLPTDAEWSLLVGLKEDVSLDPFTQSQQHPNIYPWSEATWPPPAFSANLDTGKMTGYSDNFSYSAPVGSFTPNEFKLYDLAGNVSEWVEDVVANKPSQRIVRGSSWINFTAEDCLSARRLAVPAENALPHIGFRLILELP